MRDDRIKDALEKIARRDVPDNVNLWPRIAVRLDRRNSLIQSYRAKPLALASIIILILLMLTGVAYAIGNLLGFIPGVGIIELGAPLRILAGPAAEMRDGITITIERAVSSGDKTVVIYSIEGIPTGAYPKNEKIPVCTRAPEIRLQDETVLKFSNAENVSWRTGYESKAIYAAIPVGMNSATFIIPCIYGTLPETLPENWELQLQFVAASPDLTVMPVIQVSPLPNTSGPTASDPLVLEKVIETQEGFILIGKVQMAGLLAEPTILDSISQFRITDATGRQLATKIRDDVEAPSNETGVMAWAYEIKGKQQAWPLTISVDASNVRLAQGDQLRFKFDTGPNPQAGKEWFLDKDAVLDGYHITLSSVHRLTDGYKFTLRADPQVAGVNIWLDGFNAAGGGGGGDGKGNFSLSNVYEGNVPSGELTLVISIQSVLVATVPWSITWQPDGVSAVTPDATPSSSPTICLAGDSLSKLIPPPANLDGSVLLYEPLDGVNWGVNFASLDGGQKQLITSQGNWATLSPDGSRVAYSGTDGQLHVRDFAKGEDRILEGTVGYNLRVSPDGKFIASADKGNLNITELDRSSPRYIPINAITFGLAGWSSDGTKVYITTLESHGFNLQTVDILTGEMRDLFVLEDSSRKEPYATVSPDGNWVAYRGQENNGLYLVRTDGTAGHIVMDRVPATISSIVWNLDSKWLGMSLANYNSDERTVVIIQPESCEAFILPNVHGDIQGLVLP